MISLLVLSLIKGKGDGSGVGVMKCSSVDWVLFGLLIAIATVLTTVGIIILNREHKEKEEVDYPFVDGDL